MVGSTIPSAQGGSGRPRARKKRPSGLHVVERSGYWHIVGTLRLGRRSIRVRESAGLPAETSTWEAANRIRFETEKALRDELIDEKKPSVPFSVAALAYLERERERPLNPVDVAKIQELERHFGNRRLDLIPEREWQRFVNKRQAGNQVQTRERYLTIVLAFLKWCADSTRGWIKDIPKFERTKIKRKSKGAATRRRVAELTPKLVSLMIENAGPHLRAQIAVEHATGARVSSILYGCRLCDLSLVSGKEQITFHNTKSGEPVISALTDFAVAELKRYLEWRGNLHDREGPLFLTAHKRPYADNLKAYGGQNKTAWAGMRRRTIRARLEKAEVEATQLRAAGNHAEAEEQLAEARADAELLAQMTQHWFRHHLATRLLNSGADLATVMAQGGWIDGASAMRYVHDVSKERHRRVRAALDAGLPIATPADTPKSETPEKRKCVR